MGFPSWQLSFLSRFTTRAERLFLAVSQKCNVLGKIDCSYLQALSNQGNHDQWLRRESGYVENVLDQMSPVDVFEWLQEHPFLQNMAGLHR
ncbi:MAG: hypothetical protein GY764_13980 [Halieaceae bacterium]|nr:hypothetical protein [Halieaceae bacterium]